MKIPKIVITGGPCAGKSTVMKRLQDELGRLGYKVLIISESATQFLTHGAEYADPKFQRYLIEYQLEKERICEDFARHQEGKVVIFLDRGCLDCKAYMPEDEWADVLKELHTNEIEVRDSYDAVFHLMSAAKGAQDAYNNNDNLARFESLEEAIIADDAVYNVWESHPRRIVIDSYPDFEDKVKILIKEIIEFLE